MYVEFSGYFDIFNDSNTQYSLSSEHYLADNRNIYGINCSSS